jgi:hypothetical protein
MSHNDQDQSQNKDNTTIGGDFARQLQRAHRLRQQKEQEELEKGNINHTNVNNTTTNQANLAKPQTTDANYINNKKQTPMKNPDDKSLTLFPQKTAKNPQNQVSQSTVIDMKRQNSDPNVVICSEKEFENAQQRLGDDYKDDFEFQQQRHGHQAQFSSPGKVTPKVIQEVENCSCKDEVLESKKIQ